MATNLSNANPEFTIPTTESQGTAKSRAADPRDALQALLAFSTLHDQIRRRRAEDARRYADGLGATDGDPWEYQQFVLDEVLQLVAERAQAITGAEAIAIALAEGENFICRASVGAMAPDRGMSIDPRSGFTGACLISKRITRCDDSETDARVDVKACRRLGVRSMVAVPLLGQDSIVGLLEAFSGEPFALSDNHVRSLNLLADLILAALKPEDEERIVRAARAAAADWDAQDLEKLRRVPFSEAATAPEVLPTSEAEPEDTPLEFSRGDIAPALYEAPSGSKSKALLVTLATALTAALVIAGIWWMFSGRRSTPRVVEAGRTAELAKGGVAPAQSRSVTPAGVETTGNNAPSDEPAVLPSRLERGEGPAQVSGIRHWTQDGISTVAVDLQAEVQYETHRLENPDRIYFDLRDTTLASGLNAKTIEVGDGQVARIRLGQPAEATTRVVLETKGLANFSVRMEQNPYRLVIEVRGPEATSPVPKTTVEPAKPPAPAPEAKPAMPEKSVAVAPAPVSPPAPTGSEVPARAHAPSLRIIIDAGHGGWDLGTVGRHGLLEKDLVLDVAQRLGVALRAKLGCDVIFTRKDDTYLSLEQRAELANQSQADLFVSVHANYSDLASARGVETYYSSFFSPPEAREAEFGENPGAKPITQARLSGMELKGKVDGSRMLAASVQRALYGTLSNSSPGIRNRGVREASYVVLTGTEMPSILTEISFVSSPEDEARLENPAYRQEIAEALAKGVAQYEASTRHVKVASASSKPTGR